MSELRVIILGCGGHGRVILDILQNMENVQVIGFLEDNPKFAGKIINGIKVFGNRTLLPQLFEDGTNGIVIGVGDNYIRADLFVQAKGMGFEMINAIHPRAIISEDVRIGQGVVVMAGAVINIGTKIGDNVCVNTGATVDHDNILADHSHIYPGANLTGGVTVGKYTYIGTNAAVNPYISIGSHVMVGSGAVVIADVPDNVTVAGVPAQVIKERKIK